MGWDFVAFANKTKKEYITPHPYRNHSEIAYLMSDWFIYSGVFYLISEPHRFHRPKSIFSEALCGSWSHSEYCWISDYDPIYDGNEAWEREWKDITSDVYIVLLEYQVPEVENLVKTLRSDPKSLLILGKVQEDTNSELLGPSLEEAFGNGWRDTYYRTLSLYGRGNREELLKNWPDIKY